jgi:hypothetical protein
MWTRAISLADITTGDGRFIQSQCLNAAYRRPAAGRDWPKTEKPDAHCWQQWTAALQTCFLRTDDQHNRLNRPLGYWINEPPHWDWFYSPSTDQLFNEETTINGTLESETPVNNLPVSKVSAPPHKHCIHCLPMLHRLLSTVLKSDATKAYNQYNKLKLNQRKQHGGMNRYISLTTSLLLSTASLTAPPSASLTARTKTNTAQQRSFSYPPWTHQKG